MLDGVVLNPGGGKIFSTHPDKSQGLHNLLRNEYQVSFTGVKQLGHGIKHPTTSGAEVKERVELYLYSPSRLSWPVLW